MPRKFWLMPGLDFHKLRAEMPPSQCADALVRPRACHIGAVLDYTLGLTCKPSSHAELAVENKRLISAIIVCPEQQQCLTQNPLSWSSTTIRTFEPRLGVSCDRSAWKPSFLRPSPIFSSRIRRTAPPASSST